MPTGSPPTWVDCETIAGPSPPTFNFGINTCNANCNAAHPNSSLLWPTCPAGYTATAADGIGSVGARCCVPDSGPPANIYNYAICPGSGYWWARPGLFRNCVNDTVDGGDTYVDSYHCECVLCPPGEEFFSGQGWCLSEDCDPGECFCDLTQECTPCPEQLCIEELNCEWNPATCQYDCDEPGCAFDEEYDYDTCACVPCPDGYCWCETTGTCVPCPEQECSVERSCTWNTDTCQWDCTDIVCAEDEYFDWDLCECIECPEGQKWCQLTEECVDAPVQCEEELNCRWRSSTCEWECDEPPCDTWSYETCRCEFDGVDLAETSNGWKFRTYRDDSGIGTGGEPAVYVQRSKDEGETWETPVLISTDDVGEAAPALAVDPATDDIHLWYHKSSPDAQGHYSPDHGETWVFYQEEEALRLPRPAFMHDRFLLAAFNGDSLNVYQWLRHSTATRELAVTFGTQPQQRVVLLVDRRQAAHIIYENEDEELIHRASYMPDDFGSWAGVTTLVPVGGKYPAAAWGLVQGILLWFEENTLMAGVLQTSEDGISIAFEEVAPQGTYYAHSTGVVYEQYDGVLFVGKDADGIMHTEHQAHHGFDWTVLE